MYTLIQTAAILWMIASVIYALYILIRYGIDIAEKKGNFKYPSLYGHEFAQYKIDIAKAWVKIKRLVFLIPAFFVVLVIAILCSKQLAHQACELRDGQWQTWDNGFGWSCINPDLIPEDRNFRIVTD